MIRSFWVGKEPCFYPPSPGLYNILVETTSNQSAGYIWSNKWYLIFKMLHVYFFFLFSKVVCIWHATFPLHWLEENEITPGCASLVWLFEKQLPRLSNNSRLWMPVIPKASSSPPKVTLEFRGPSSDNFGRLASPMLHIWRQKPPEFLSVSLKMGTGQTCICNYAPPEVVICWIALTSIRSVPKQDKSLKSAGACTK